MDEIENIKVRHTGSLAVLWKIYQSGKVFYDNFYFIISFYLSLEIICISVIFSSNLYDNIQFFATSALSIIPSLLGFSLGAYILVVGFGATDILATIAKPLKKQGNFSLYQKLNAVMGMTVLVEIATLLFSFILCYLSKILPVITVEKGSFIYVCCSSINASVLFLLIFLSIYSILMLANIIKHVFLFAQTIHLIVTVDNLKKEKEQISNQNRPNL